MQSLFALPLVLLLYVIANKVVSGCHTKVIPTSRSQNGPRSKREILETETDEMVDFFTKCMEQTAGNEVFKQWRSVVEFSIKDTKWFVESDLIYCNKSSDAHTAECWRYNVDYLVKTSSTLNEATKICVAQYDLRDHATKEGAVIEDSRTGTLDLSLSVPKTSNITKRTSSTSKEKKCSRKNKAFHECMMKPSLVTSSSSRRQFGTILRTDKERTFDEDVLKFIIEHLSDCSATKQQRINQLQVCEGANVTDRSLEVNLHGATSASCVKYSNVISVLKESSPLVLQAKKCKKESTANCLPPKPLKHGTVKDCTKPYPVNTTCSLICEKGFQLDIPAFKIMTCHSTNSGRKIWIPSGTKCLKTKN